MRLKTRIFKQTMLLLLLLFTATAFELRLMEGYHSREMSLYEQVEEADGHRLLFYTDPDYMFYVNVGAVSANFTLYNRYNYQPTTKRYGIQVQFNNNVLRLHAGLFSLDLIKINGESITVDYGLKAPKTFEEGHCALGIQEWRDCKDLAQLLLTL